MTRARRLLVATVALAVCLAGATPGAGQGAPAFVAIVLGAGGGPGQDDLSAYLLAPAGSTDYVALDAGTLLEASYPDGRPDSLLFGHLTPAWLMRELRRLSELVEPAAPTRALRRLTVVVTHVKPALEAGSAPRERIARQLTDRNDLGVPLVMARQGERIEF